MSARAEYFRQLARKCAAAADAAAEPVTKAKFEQEQHQWLLRAEQAVKTERNLMTLARGSWGREPSVGTAHILSEAWAGPLMTAAGGRGRSGKLFIR